MDWLNLPVIALALGALVVVVAFVYFVPVGLWITALFSGVRVGLGTLIGMRLRKVNPHEIIRPLISATKAGLQLDIGQMEAHYLAGGDVGRVVTALISADRANIDLTWRRATAIDLAGRDVLEAVRVSVNPKVIQTPRISAVAKDGIQLIAVARVTVRANIDRLVNERHVNVIDRAGYQAVLDGPGPMISLTVHTGNWDLLAAHIKASTDRPGLGIYDPPDNPAQAALLKKARQSYMGEAISGEGAARGVFKHLTQKDRATLYILVDERRELQVWFPTFGRELMPSGNLSVALRLARKVGAKFLPFYLARTDGPYFDLHWHPPLDPQD